MIQTATLASSPEQVTRATPGQTSEGHSASNSADESNALIAGGQEEDEDSASEDEKPDPIAVRNDASLKLYDCDKGSPAAAVDSSWLGPEALAHRRLVVPGAVTAWDLRSTMVRGWPEGPWVLCRTALWLCLLRIAAVLAPDWPTPYRFP
jgi:hypothetical protein